MPMLRQHGQVNHSGGIANILYHRNVKGLEKYRSWPAQWRPGAVSFVILCGDDALQILKDL